MYQLAAMWVKNGKIRKNHIKYEGVGGNLFAFACKKSKDMGFGGYVGFVAKTSLIDYYRKALGAELSNGQRMYIEKESAEKLINILKTKYHETTLKRN